MPAEATISLSQPDNCKSTSKYYKEESTLHGQADLLHPLLEDRVSSGLTNDQVCPLHDHNADKEGCMASELHYLPLFIGLESRQSREHSDLLPLLSGAHTKFSRH